MENDSIATASKLSSSFTAKCDAEEEEHEYACNIQLCSGLLFHGSCAVTGMVKSWSHWRNIVCLLSYEELTFANGIG